MRLNTIILVTFLQILLFGCLATGQSIRTGREDFSILLTADKKCAAVGETLHLKASVTNASSQTKVVELKDRPVFDMIIGTPQGGDKRWSDGKPLTPELTRLELLPGESKSIEMDWVSTGTTSVAVRFITDKRFQEVPVSTGFVIPTFCPGIGP